METTTALVALASVVGTMGLGILAVLRKLSKVEASIRPQASHLAAMRASEAIPPSSRLPDPRDTLPSSIDVAQDGDIANLRRRVSVLEGKVATVEEVIFFKGLDK